MQLVTTNIYVFWHGKMLLIKRSASDSNLPNVWEAPAGHVDVKCPPGDSYCARLEALRELREETGLFGLSKDLTYLPQFSTPTHTCYTLILKDSNSPKIQLSHEHQDFFWLKLTDPMNAWTIRPEVLSFVKAIV